jgi:hypothetical protein
MPLSDIQPTVPIAPLPAIANDLFCQTCGYNLRGLTGSRCPECGGSLDGVRSLVPQIPWMYRKELGWWRAYWRTIGFVMFRQAQFCDEMARPVRFRDSQFFRWITVVFCCVPVLLAGIAFSIFGTYSPTDDDVFNLFWVGGFGGVWHACVPLFFAAVTGIPSYFFHPRDIPVEQQNRAIVLSYYACGPLVFLGIPIMTCAAAILTAQWSERATTVLIVLSLTLPIAAIAPWWLDLIHLARRLVPQRPQRAVSLAVGVPILWFLLALAILVGIPFVLFYFFLIFASLR